MKSFKIVSILIALVVGMTISETYLIETVDDEAEEDGSDYMDHQPQPYGGGGQENAAPTPHQTDAPPQSYAPPQNNDQPQHQNFAPAEHHHVPPAATPYG